MILRWMTQFYCRWPALIKMMSVVKVVDSHQTSRTKKQKVAPNGVAELESKSPTAWFLQQNFHLTRPWGVASKSVYEKWATAEQKQRLEEFHPASEISRRTRKNHEISGIHEGHWLSDAETVVKDSYLDQQPLYSARRKSQDLSVLPQVRAKCIFRLWII